MPLSVFVRMISLAAVRRGELVVNDAIKRVREPVNEFGESQEGSAAHDDCCLRPSLR
jgi:hypothetical protein